MQANLLKSIVATSLDAIVCADGEGRITLWNPAAERMFGYAEAEAVGQSLAIILREEDRAAHLEGIRHFVETGEGLLVDKIMETMGRRKDGSVFPKEMSLAAEKTDGEWLFTAILRDISERKQAEEGRARRVADLRARNEELTQFADTVAHDLKTPLITLDGYLILLARDLEKGATARVHHDMGRITEAVDSVRCFLDRLLQLARAGKKINCLETVGLAELTHKALAARKREITARGIRVELDRAMPVVMGDRVRLGEVWDNLIDNALKSMKGQREPCIEIKAGQEGDEVLCHVRDNGRGLQPSMLERVFDPCLRGDVREGGAGLGLDICRRIIEAHGGRIWAESEGEGRGACFYFTLPGPEK